MRQAIKIMGLGALIVMVVVGISFLTSQMAYKQINNTYYEQMAGMIGKVVQVHPESEVLLMKALKEIAIGDQARGKDILRQYGYGIEKTPPQTIQKSFRIVWQWSLVLVVVILSLVGCGFYISCKILKARLSHLQHYLAELAKGNYTLQIQGMEEGRWSIFEDEIYKTTVSLREEKERQEKEKINLAQNIADISHQLKTPLTSMGIMTELLEESEIDELSRQFIDKLNKQIDRMSQLVGALLKLAKFDSGTIKLKKEQIQVAHLIDEVLEGVEEPSKKKEVEFSVEGEPRACVRGDFNWSYEAVQNVIYNCVQHSPIKGKINISWSSNPIYVELVIQDEGGGISQKDLPHLFTRFYRGENASKESLGIGLALAKTIIEKQNGEIRVVNISGGCKFIIKFYQS